MSRRQRVLVMVHPTYRPDRSKAISRTEKDVWNGLRRAGFLCQVAPIQDDLKPLEEAVTEFKPHAVFNLLEEFRDEAVFDFHAVSWLEAHGIPFTGCNPRGLILTRNKFWMSNLAKANGVNVPETRIAEEALKLRRPDFPLIVKYCNEHASLGLSNRNVVNGLQQLKGIVRGMKSRHAAQLITQKFIAGREVSVSVIGNRTPEVFAPREVLLGNPNAIITERVKFSARIRFQRSIRARRLPGPPALISRLQADARSLYLRFGLNGYARFDFRVGLDQIPYLIDVNVNPNLERSEDLAQSAIYAGYSYEELLREILRRARDYYPSL